MNLGPGSLGQLFDWGAGQVQQQALSGSAPQVCHPPVPTPSDFLCEDRDTDLPRVYERLKRLGGLMTDLSLYL